MTEQPSRKSKVEKCSKLERSLMEIVEQARDLFQKIDEAEMLIHDCKLLDTEEGETEEGENEHTALQAHSDWLALARPQLQLLREQFHHLLATLPDDVKKRIGGKLSIQELTRLFGDEDVEAVETEHTA